MIIKDGLLALPGEGRLLRADLAFSGERITSIASSITPTKGEEVIDASGLMVFPAAIDPHVHFDEPGFTHREDFLHGTMEAAKGGVGTIIDMPCTSLPPVTTKAAYENKLSVVQGKALVDYAFFGGVSGHTAESSLSGGMEELAPFVVAFKCYFISGMDSFTAVDHDQFKRVLIEGTRLGRPILLHAEDPGCVKGAEARLAAERRASGRASTWRDYLEPRNPDAELVAAASALALARGREAGLHIVHVGTAEVARMVAAAGATCETCAHYLAFDEDDFGSLGAALKTAPPVKTASDRAGLWQLLTTGSISFLASDHAPAPEAEKATGDPLTAYGGIPGVGTGFPYLLSEGFLSGRMPLARFLEASSLAAARRYGLAARKGSLEIGKDADFVLVDPAGTTTLEGRSLLSLGKITPFEGMRLTGRIVGTWVRGGAVYEARNAAGPASIVASPGSGKHLTWGYR
ncbi:MAG: dihydroorotase [Rectinemataceae bacterium]